MKTPCLLAIISLAILLPSSHGATIAYWRFEEGAVNSDILAAVDSTGNSLHTLTPLRPARNGSGAIVPEVGNPQYLGNTAFPTQIPATGTANGRTSGNFHQSGRVLGNSGFNFFNGNTGEWTVEFFWTAQQALNGGVYRYLTIGDATAYGALSISLNSSGARVTWAGITGTNMDDFAPEWGGAVGTPYHLALVRRNDTSTGTISLYVNNELAVTASLSGLSAAVPTSGIYVGGSNNFDTLGQFANGTIDELRISDTALRPSEFLTSIPEPGSLFLGLVGGALFLLCGRRHRQSANSRFEG